MVIDKKLNLDKELEYFADGGLAFAQNIVVSDDGLTIQNEPAIVDFVSMTGFTLVGFIACNEEFVLFGTNTDGESEVYRVHKNETVITEENKCYTNWQWCGGEVFGTFIYNVNNELIVAISERYLPDGVDCPLKIINLERDKYIDGVDDNIYTLTPDIPHSNMINITYVLGNRIKKGKYNFFIKYHIEDIYETGWFPIGVPVFVYDNLEASEIKSLIEEHVQVTEDFNDSGVPNKIGFRDIKFGDYYNKDTDYTNNNVLIDFEIDNELNYTHYTIGYIVNTTAGFEGYKTNKFNISTKKIQIGTYQEAVSVDELTINYFNLYNVNTLCNYKNRLYLANYKEENRNDNDVLKDIDVSKIKVHYNKDDITIPFAFDWTLLASSDDDISLYNDNLKDQWKSKPGRFGIYNFFIHYVYPNGNYTDGIKIGDIEDYKYTLVIGKRTTTTEVDGILTTKTVNLSTNVTSTTTTNDILGKMQEYEDYYNAMVNTSFVRDAILNDFCVNHPDEKWYTIEYLWIEQEGVYNSTSVDTVSTLADEEMPTNLVTLDTYCNSKGEILFRMPGDVAANTRKLWFTGIKMYPQFVGYFISYEEPEYIQIGEGFLASDSIDRDNTDTTLYPLVNTTSEFSSSNWRFYYPEFNIIGGKTNITKIYHTGNNNHEMGWHYTNDFVGSDEQYSIVKSMPVAPNDAANKGKEGYLKIRTSEKATIAHVDTNKSFTAINNNYNIYLSDNKKLISLGFIEYQTYNPATPNNTFTYGYKDALYNYDFYRCFSSIIYFGRTGVIVNQASPNPIDASSGDEYYYFDGNGAVTPESPHVACINYWHETHYPLFLKEINQAPESIFYSYYRRINSGKAEQYQLRNFVANPNYVNDLYKLDNVYYDYTGKLLVNYDKTLVSNSMNQYDKTIRRSDVIQSESVVNSWRFFRPENYKIITEDKGAINNIIGIGNYLFAHCEHSLFLFDITDSLQALDKNVQLLQPDTFDVAYKEVFTADKGFGGLQDFNSWICDEFGYIFYDNSAKSIYRYDGGKLINMNEGIDRFIKLYQPNYIYMGNDRTNNRILFNFGFNKTILDKTIIDNLIISYNLVTNSWSSTHSYATADKFISIKDKIFILDRNVVKEGDSIVNTVLNIAEFDYINEKDAYTFNNYSMLPTTNILATKNDSSFIDVVFTANSYNKIKVLDFITYIINKDSYDDGFSNLQLEIYTNCCYSGVIDISQERKKVTEYKKPYYDYERWNFNWFRNVLNKFDNGEIVNRLTGKIVEYDKNVKRGYDNALMTGKYAVIRFIFKNTNKPVFIKDIQAYFKP